MKINFKFALIASVVALVAISLSVANYMGYTNLVKLAMDDIKQSMSQHAKNEAYQLSTYFQAKVKGAGDIADYYKNEPSYDEFQDITRLALVAKAMDAPVIMVGYNDGLVMS